MESFFSSASFSSLASVPRNEWQPDQLKCDLCQVAFTWFRRRHHCRMCGRCICKVCSPNRLQLDGWAWPQRVCMTCIGGAPATPRSFARSATDAAICSIGPQPSPVVLQRVLQEVVALREEVKVLSGTESRSTEQHANSEQPSAAIHQFAARPSHSTASPPQRHSRIAAEGEHNFRAVSRPRGITGDWTPYDGDDCYYEVLDAHPYKHELGFPYSLGPFKLSQTSSIRAEHLEVVFDSFETELLDPSGAPAAGHRARLGSIGINLRWKLKSKIRLPPGSGDPVPGVLSALQDVNLTDMARRAAGIPEEAKQYAWFHPIFPNMKAHSFDVDLKFLKNGGFVYLDDSEPPKPVHICALEPDPAGGQMLFGRPKRLCRKWSERLMQDGRFQPVTLDALQQMGATHFCMISNGEEFDGEQICPKGGFAYHFSNEALRNSGMPDVQASTQCA